MKIGEIYDFIDTFAPYSSAMEWDNSGINIGNRDKDVKKVLMALDVTSAVAEEAAKKRCGLIISHHPVIFKEMKNIDSDSVVYSLIHFNISALSAHTNFDKAPGGMCDILGYLAGIEKMSDIAPDNANSCGRIGFMPQMTLYSFAEKLKMALSSSNVQIHDAHRSVNHVAVVSGCGNDEVGLAAEAGADTLLTGELSYQHWLEAREYGMNVVAAGHFETENPGVLYLKTMLENKFTDVTFELSEECKGIIETA